MLVLGPPWVLFIPQNSLSSSMAWAHFADEKTAGEIVLVRQSLVQPILKLVKY